MMNLSRRLLGSAQSPPPGNGLKPNDAYIAEASFDTNMMVILAALLCSLICALGLNSIVRCALRCRYRFGMETPEEAARRVATTGVKKRALRKIPVAVYGEEEMKIPGSECPICLGDYVEGERIRVLPKCNHGFHVKCIDKWLLSHSSCPNCRQSLLEKQPASSRVTDEGVTGAPAPESRAEQVVSVAVVVDVGIAV